LSAFAFSALTLLLVGRGDCSFCCLCSSAADDLHIHEQVAGYIGQLVRGFGEPVRLGVVQTAYANGSSTLYITDVLVSHSLVCLLWSPYVIGQAIIFLPCGFFLLSSIFLFFLARLISVAAGWMSTIL